MYPTAEAGTSQGAGEPLEVARRAVEDAWRLLDMDGATLYCWDATAGVLCVAAWSVRGRRDAVDTGVPPALSELDAPSVLAPGQGVAGQSFARREPLVVDSYQGWADGTTRGRTSGIASAVAVPLLGGKTAYGVLLVYSHTSRRIEPAEVERLHALAGRITRCAGEITIHAIAERRRAESDTLAALIRGGPDGDAEAVAARVTASAGRLLNADYALVLLDNGEHIAWRGPWELPTVPRAGERSGASAGFGALAGAASAVISREQTQVVYPDGKAPVSGQARALPAHPMAPYRTILSTPLCVEGRALGALVVGWRSSIRVGGAMTWLAETLAAYTATIVDRMAAEARPAREQWRQAVYDPLTNLPNRTLFHDRLQQAALAGARNGSSLALLLFDLDHFKDVNDTLGHHYGDLVLQEVAERLRGVLRASDSVARLGGDEFAVLLPGGDRRGAARTARKIVSALARPVVVDGRRLYVAASIGIALYPAHGDDPHTLLRRADIAMYSAKRNRSGHAFYTAATDTHTPERLALNEELRHAIAHDELVLHYQPRVAVQNIQGDGAAGAPNAPNRRIVPCVEALVRWRHPRYGLLLPDRFIPLAESTGLIEPLTRWVLAGAIRQCREWRDAGLTLGVAVNLSAANLRDPRLADTIVTLLSTHGVAPDALTVELTESTVMADAEQAMAVLARLSAHGIHIAIDDFGTGYSSLAYLKRLPVAELKIDKSFVLHMAEDDADRAIVSSTIGLGHSLGLGVVAEGVEDERAWDLLSAMKCDGAQGYYLSRPLPAAGLTEWLATNPASL